jgi:HEAT repeat protein
LSVRTEQSEVSNTLQVAARNAVTRVQGNIQQSADRAVAKIVNDQIAPELKKLRAYSDLSSAVALARAGDGNGMDRLAQIAVDDQALPEIRRAARATIDSVAGLMTYGPAYAFGGDCKTGQPSAKPLQSVSFYVSLLSRRSTDDRYQGAFCLGRPADFLSAGQNEQSLRDAMEPLFRAMAEDPDLSVRKAAFSSFVHIGEWIYPKEPVAGEIRLFENAANAKWWSENRARFISRQSNH